MFTALIWRPLRNDYGRTLLSLLAVALGVAVVIAIRVANRSAIASFQTTTDALAGGADLLVSGPEPVPASLLPSLFPLNAQAEILPYLDRRVFNPGAPDGGDTLEILGVDLLASAGAYRGTLETAGPEHAGMPQLLLPHAYAVSHGLHPGDNLALVAGGVKTTFTVAAVLPASELPSEGDVALLDLPQALAVFEPGRSGDQAAFDGLRVKLAPGTDATALAAKLAALVPAADHVAAPRSRQQQDQKMLAAFRANLTALAYVSLLIGIFLIYNTVSISVVRRRTAIATLRALGASRRRITGLFLSEGLTLGLVGGVIGWGLGWVLARVALGLVEATLSNIYAATHTAALALRGGDLVWAVLLGAGAGLLAAWAPARQAAQVAPAQALRPGGAEASARARASGWAGSSFLALAAGLGIAAFVLTKLPEPGWLGGGLPWWGFGSALAAALAVACLAPPLLAAALPRLQRVFLSLRHFAAGMAASGLAGALRRTSVLTAALAIAIGVMLGVAIMVGSFRQTVALWLQQQLQADVFVRAADWDRNHPVALSPAIVDSVVASPGVAAAEASHTQTWSFRRQTVFLNTRWTLAGSPPAAAIYRYLSGGPGAVTVSEPFARRFDLWTGDHLALAAPHGRLDLTIAGVFYDYASNRGQIVLAPPLYVRGFGSPTVTEMGLFASPGVRPADLRRRIYLAPYAAGLVVNDNRSLRAAAMQVFDRTFRITYALEVITLLVAILGVANTLLAVVLERGPEFAVLRYLGTTKRQLRAILLAESGLVATAALALGWLLGWVLSLILVRVINVQSFGWTIQFHTPWAFLLPASAAVWCATLAAGWFPARAAERNAGATGLRDAV